jgi:hypothetical protein
MTDTPVSPREVLQDLLAGHLPPNPAPTPEQWERVIELAVDHEVSGFLYKAIHPHTLELRVPPEALTRLKDDYLLNQVRYFQYVSRVAPIFAALNRHQIQFFVYKGLSLIEHYYRDPGLRAIIDVDLVVHQKDIPVVSEIIRGYGFTARDEQGLHFDREDLCLDIHQDLFRLDRVPSRALALSDRMETVWNRLVPCSFQGSVMARLDPVDEFIILGWHALKHSFSHLKWLVDLKLMYQNLSGCSDFLRRLHTLPDDSIRTGVWYALRLLNEWLRVPVSPTLICALAPGKSSRVEHRAFDRLQAGMEVRYFAELCFLRTIKGAQAKLMFMRDMLLCGDSEGGTTSQKGWHAVGTMVSRLGRLSPSLIQQAHRLAGRW